MELRILVLLCTVGAALAGPNPTSDKCSTHCSEDSSKFQYEEGAKYIYTYEGINVISIKDAVDTQQSIIKAKAEITVAGKCDMVLQLTDIRIQHGNEVVTSSPFIAELTKNDLPFSFDDGHIEHICAAPDETSEAKHVKSAILSALQNSMTNLRTDTYIRESDILGSCDTEYVVKEHSFSEIEIEKSKDLRSCTHRQGLTTFVQADPYSTLHSPTPSLPILTDEEIHCEQHIKDNIVEKVTCHESNTFRPFSNHGNLATSKGEVTLQFVEVKHNVKSFPVRIFKRESLIYQHEPEKPSSEKESEVMAIIRDLCPKVDGVMHKDSARLFSKLVHAIRGVPYEGVERLYNSFKSGRSCRSPKALDMFLDALRRAGTAGPVQMIVKLIETKAINTARARAWMGLMAFIPKPSKEVLAAALPLITSDNVPYQGILGVTSLFHRYCTKHPDCKDDPSVISAISSLHKHLGYKCRSATPDEEEKIIRTLKAFGNLGLAGEALETLLDCAITNSNSLPIRRAAIESFRRMPPYEEMVTKMTELLENSAEDVELRIASYLALMQSPNEEVIEKVVKILNKETSRQVASFMWTHLSNLEETEIPIKQHIREMLIEHYLKKKFEPDFWKYSTNTEWSEFSDETNLGASLENNVIFVPGSFFPRSATVNVSVDLFGYHINLLEIDGRIEGVEHSLEKMFGPHGYLSDVDSLAELVENFVSDKDSNRIRNKRSSHYQQKVDLLNERVSMGSRGDPSGSIGFKVFGNELAWYNFRKGSSDHSEMDDLNFDHFLSELAKNNKVDFSRSTMLIDATLEVPSVTGRAYVLDLNGTATVGVKADGRFDVKGLQSSPLNCDIDGHLQPSATIELSALMAVKSVAQPGLKIVTTLHTSSDIEGKIEIRNGRTTNLRISTPGDKVEIFSVKSGLYEVDAHDNEKPIKVHPTHNFDRCTKSLTKALGIEICAHVELPRPLIQSESPYIPLLEPLDVEYSIRKTDLSPQGYEVNLEIPDYSGNVEKVFKLSIDTPGSKTQRKRSVELKIADQRSDEVTVTFNYQCPYKVIEASGSFISRPNLFRIKAGLVADRSRRYGFSADVEKQIDSSRQHYIPTIEITWPRAEPFIIRGFATHLEGAQHQLTIDLQSNKPANKPFQIKGKFIRDGEVVFFTKDAEWKLQTDIEFKSPILDTRIYGTREKHGTVYSSDMTIEYQKAGFSKHNIKANTKVQNLSTEHLYKITAVSEVRMSQYPENNVHLSWDFQRKPYQHLENDITLKYGENLQDPQNTIHLLQVAKLSGRYWENKEASAENKFILTAPAYNIDFGINFNSEWDSTEVPKFHLNAGVKWATNKAANTEVRYLYHSLKPVKLAAEYKLDYPGREIIYRDQLEETSPNEYRGQSFFQWQRGQHRALKYVYKVKCETDRTQHELDITTEGDNWIHPMHHTIFMVASNDGIEFKCQSTIDGKPHEIDFKSKNGESSMKLDLPHIKGTITGKHPDAYHCTTDVDLRTTFRNRDRHIKGSLKYERQPNVKRSMDLELLWDADKDQTRKISYHAIATVHPSNAGSFNKYNIETKTKITDVLKIDNTYEISHNRPGPHDVRIAIEGKYNYPIVVTVHYERKDGQVTSSLKYQHNNVEKLRADVGGKFVQEGTRLDIGGKIAIVSLFPPLENKEISFSHTHDFYSSTRLFNVEGRLQLEPKKVYTGKIDYSRVHQHGAGNIRARALVTSPHPTWKSEQASINAEYNPNSFNFNFDVSPSSGRKFEVSTSMENRPYGVSGRYEMRTPYPNLRATKYEGMYELSPTRYAGKTLLEVNRQKKFDISGHLNLGNQFDGQASVSTALTPTISGHIRRTKDSQNIKYDIGLKRNADDILVSKAVLNKRPKGFTFKGELYGKGKELLILQVDNTNQPSGEREYIIKSQGIFKPLSITVRSSRSGNEIKPVVTICSQGNANCLTVDGSIEREITNERSHRNYKLHVRKDPDVEFTVLFLRTKQVGRLRHKFLFSSKDKKYGYDISYSLASGTRNVGITVIIPTRRVEYKSNFVKVNSDWTLKVDLLSDAEREPNRKLALTATRKVQDSPFKATTEISLSHPVLEKPLSLHLSRDDSSFKGEFDYSTDPNEKITLHLDKNFDTNNKTASAHLFRGDHKLDLSVNLHFARDGERITYGYVWNWMTRFGRPKQGFFLVDKVPGNKHFWYRRGDWAIDIMYKLTPNDQAPKDKIEAVVESIMNGQHMKSNILIDKPNKFGGCGEMSVYYSDKLTRKYHVCSNSTGRPVLAFALDSFATGEKVTDLSITLSEWVPHIFSLHIHWNPAAAGVAMMHALQLPHTLRNTKITDAPAEFYHKHILIGNSLSEKVGAPIKNFAIQESEKIRGELRREKGELRSMYQKLAEVLPSADDIKKVLVSLERNIAAEWKEFVKNLDDITAETVKEFFRTSEIWMKELMQQVCPKGTSCGKLRQAYEIKGWDGIKEVLEKAVEEQLDTFMEKLFEELYEIKEYMKKCAQDCKERLKSMFQYFKSDGANKMKERFQKAFGWLDDKLGEYRYNIDRKIQEIYKAIAENEDIQARIAFYKEVEEAIIKEFQEHQFLLPKFMRDAVDKDKQVQQNPLELLVDPENGDMRIKFRMPFRTASVHNAIRQMDLAELLDDDDDDDDDDIMNLNYLKDLAQLSKVADLPVLSSEQAMLVGGQHFVTFDKTFYDFTGECSYLLARDFMDGNFTVIVKFSGSDPSGAVKKSIIAIVKDHHIEINPAEKAVTLDDQVVDLPLAVGPVRVTRVGETIVLDDNHGMTVMCHLSHDVCSTTVSGWYHGKTAGLFGTYDHEPSNDMQRPRGQIAHTTGNFAKSWEVGKNCRSKNLAKEVEVPAASEGYRLCKKYFKDYNSPLEHCYSTVNPDNYFKMCLRHMATDLGHKDSRKALCNVAAAYGLECKSNNIQFRMPPRCLTCDSPDGREIEYGDKRVIQEDIPSSADIVFVFEMKECNREIIKDIDNTARLLDRELNSNGYTNNRYAVVGFGGKMPVHAHTARGKVFFDVPDVVLATERMNFVNGRNGKVDTFGALLFASDYPYRPGVAKILVLSTCSACKEEYMSISYPVAQQMLLERGIVLHVLNDRAIEIKGSASKGKGIFAVDADTVYRSKDVTQKELEGQPDLRSQVAVPKDVCITLAQEVHGSFFTTQPIKDKNFVEGKNWKSLLARRITKTAKPPLCQECECIDTEEGVSQPICRPCAIPRPKIPIRLYTSEDPEYF